MAHCRIKGKRYNPHLSFVLGNIIGIIGSIFIVQMLSEARGKQNECKKDSHFAVPEQASMSFPPEKNGRSYHQCNYETIPYVSNMLETAQFLLYHTNNSFIRYGDGEATLMSGGRMFFQEANESLAHHLLKGLLSNLDNVSIGIPNIFSGPVQLSPKEQDWWYDRDLYRQFYLKNVNMSRQYFWTSISAAFTSAGNTSCHLLPLLYSTLRMIWNNKDLVMICGNNGQVYQYDIYDTAASKIIIYAPKYNGWSEYQTLKRIALEHDASKLFVLSCGPACKVLAYELALTGRRCLELGHLAKDYDSYLSGKKYQDFYAD